MFPCAKIARNQEKRVNICS